MASSISPNNFQKTNNYFQITSGFSKKPALIQLLKFPSGLYWMRVLFKDAGCLLEFLRIFFNCFLAAPLPTLGHYPEGSLTHAMYIAVFLHIRPKGHREPRSEVGSLSPAEHLMIFEPGTFRFLLQRLYLPGHSPLSQNK